MSSTHLRATILLCVSAITVLAATSSTYADAIAAPGSARVTVVIPEIQGIDVPAQRSPDASMGVNQPRNAVELRVFSTSAEGERYIRKFVANEPQVGASPAHALLQSTRSLGSASQSWNKVEDEISGSSTQWASNASEKGSEVVYELWQF